MNSNKHSSQGFSLIEVLTILGPISIVLTILAPALRAARDHGRITACRSNLNAIGLALRSYGSV